MTYSTRDTYDEMLTTNLSNQDIIEATDQCVMCGLCLPYCPTYSVAKNEAESPRGRIALVRALHESKLHPTPTLVAHLDNCLACMSCEAACPANVDYEKILDAGRNITRDRHSLLYRFKQSLLLFILTKTKSRKLVKYMLKIYYWLGMHYLLKKITVNFPYALRLFYLIPKPQKINFPTKFASNVTKGSRVALVNSCAGDLFSDITEASAKYILRALNCEVVNKYHTHCCGALHQHNGHLNTAKDLMQEFTESFNSKDFDALLSMATGCAAQLNRYPGLLDDEATTELIGKHIDINAFILQRLEKHKLHFKPLPQKVFVHKPCTQKLTVANPRIIEQLLHQIPGIRLSFFQDGLVCCGAGGMNTFTQAKLADNLINNKISEVQTSDAAYLVTSNIGCALHFEAQLQKNNNSIIVCHPITLLAKQLLYSEDA